jgi:hypothetical protein
MLTAVLVGALGIVAFNIAHRTWLNHRELSFAERKNAIDLIWQTDPALAAWSRFRPDTYQSGLTVVEVEAVTKQIPLDRRDALIRAGKRNSSFEFAVEQGLTLASDDSVIAYADALVTAAEKLEQHDAQACADYLYPRVLGADLSGMISTETLNADTVATAAVLSSGASHAGSQLPEYQVLQLIAPILRDLSKEFGSEWHVMNEPYARDIDASLLCRVELTFCVSKHKRSGQLPSALGDHCYCAVSHRSNAVVRHMLPVHIWGCYLAGSTGDPVTTLTKAEVIGDTYKIYYSMDPGAQLNASQKGTVEQTVKQQICGSSKRILTDNGTAVEYVYTHPGPSGEEKMSVVVPSGSCL